MYIYENSHIALLSFRYELEKYNLIKNTTKNKGGEEEIFQ